MALGETGLDQFEFAGEAREEMVRIEGAVRDGAEGSELDGDSGVHIFGFSVENGQFGRGEVHGPCEAFQADSPEAR